MGEKAVRGFRVLLVAVFFGFLAASAVLTLTRNNNRYTFYENRLLAAMPELTREGALDGSFFSGLNTYLQEHTVGRITIFKLGARLDRQVLRRPVVNGVVITEDVLLPRFLPEYINQAKIDNQAQQIADNLTNHVQLVSSYGGRFYYVAVPCQYVSYGDRYPPWLSSRGPYTVASTDSLFARLTEAGVPFLDMRPALAVDPARYASTVDNHFTIYGAYETYRTIMDRLNADTSWDLDTLESGEFDIVTLPNPYMGSRERKLYDTWDSDESLELLIPRDSVPFRRSDEDGETDWVYRVPQTDTEPVLYNTYMGGDHGFTTLHTNRPELPTVLIYGDSFTNILECILWHDFDTMYSLDFRHYDDMSLSQFIDQYQPDVVLCVRDYEAMLSPEENGQ